MAPEVPAAAVQFTQDGAVYVMRNLIDNNPLYTLDADEPGKSNCLDACAEAWRPLWAQENDQPIGKWTAIRRIDGSAQWAYEGRPVYSFARDPEAVSLGDGRVGSWHLLPTLSAR